MRRSGLSKGLADYLAHQVAVEQTGDHERQWARLVRGQGRRGVHLDQWIEFHTIGDYGAWNSERSLDRLKQMYGQSFAALSYVAAAYGEAAFLPLLRAVIEEPDDLNVPFRRILGVSFDQFQAAVREFLLTPTPFEAEMEAVGVYARAVFEIADENRELAASWDLFLRFRRPSLDPEASAAEIMEFSDAFVALQRARRGPRASGTVSRRPCGAGRGLPTLRRGHERLRAPRNPP